MTASGIYAIVNNTTKGMYIGSAINMTRRLNTHRQLLRKNKHYSLHLQNAYRKHGETAFSYEIVEFVSNKTELIDREQVWIDFFKPTYNKRKKANSPLGTKHSDETRMKMSLAHKNKVFTDEHRANLSKARKGVPISESQKALLSELHKGKIITKETCAKISSALVGNTNAAGQVYSEERRVKISERMKKLWALRKLQKGL